MPSNIFIGIIIALVVALGLVAFDRHVVVVKLEAARETIGTQQGQLQALQNDLKSKDEVIAKQNAGIDELNKAAEDRAVKVAKAVEEAKKDSAKNKKFAQDLLLAKRQSDNACKDAEDLINNYLGFK